MAVTLNKANLVLKDANGNIGKIEQLSDRDLTKIRTVVSDVALVVNQSNHTPIEATTTNKGVVQLATPADVVFGASDKVVTAEQLHNATTGTSALATENLARIDAVVTEAGIPIDHTNTNQLKTAVTTLVNNAVPSTATSTTLGVVKPDNDTITIDSNGVLTATAQMPGVATTTNVGVVKPDNDTITIDSNGVLTATAQMPGVATNATVGVVKPDGNTITVDGDGTLTATAQMPGVATTSSVGVVQPDGRTITITADGVISAIGSGGGSGSSVTGEIKWFASNIVPDGYIICNGAKVSRETYADLFAVIGTSFGEGDGSTTFDLPDLIDRFVQGSRKVGTYIAEQLPNIKTSDSGGLVVIGAKNGSNPPLSTGTDPHSYVFNGGGGVIGYVSLNFNAHNANAIYEDNGHVYPQSLTLLPCIKY